MSLGILFNLLSKNYFDKGFSYCKECAYEEGRRGRECGVKEGRRREGGTKGRREGGRNNSHVRAQGVTENGY